jgi:hypothetical protein
VSHRSFNELSYLRAGLDPDPQIDGVSPRHLPGLGFTARLLGCVLPFSLNLAILSSAAAEAPRPGTPVLKPKTSQAFAEYVRATEARNNSELQRNTNLLWIDELPDALKRKAYLDLARGSVQLEQRNTLENGREIPCPNGMIHHWEGLVFIPGARLDDALRVLEDYNHHAEYYSPDVERSKIESQNGNHYRVFLRFHRQKVITVVLNSEHDVRYFRDSDFRAHSRSTAIHIAEVENPGKHNEQERPRDDDNGFLWGMETWWRMEEKDGGVYVQSEVVSLTRAIPPGLGWMVGPFVAAVPGESLTFTLEATRKAVLGRMHAIPTHSVESELSIPARASLRGGIQ